jgi:hypothetical protein
MWTTLSGGVKSVQDRARQPSRVEEPAQHVLRLVDPLEIRSELGKGTLGGKTIMGAVVSLAEAARRYGVSSATVGNWRTRYLTGRS